MRAERDVGIVGGCGHVGLPLGLAFAQAGLRVTLYDQNGAAVDMVGAGKMPFLEAGAPRVLDSIASSGRLLASVDAAVLRDVEHIVVVIGTPIDPHLNPEPNTVPNAIVDLLEHLRNGQHLALRSTVYPGVTAMVEQLLASAGLRIDVSYCPERIAEGRAMTELRQLPQIVSSRTAPGRERATNLFRTLTQKIVHLDVEEAELAKLFTNTWRYIKFAAANQLFMIANDLGLDYERIRSALRSDYPRAADLPSAGFAAGPCLLKDTMQLAALDNNNFSLGHASMMINEGLPDYLLSRLERRFDLRSMTVGILGMAFKAESDDIRSSLSYQLRRVFRERAHEVLCSDPYVDDDDLLPFAYVVSQSDLLIIGAPHGCYAEIRTDTPVIDVWNLLGGGVCV
jgi:UDP-N-acetyl-D-mannosaminuronic acid dehydrogenase